MKIDESTLKAIRRIQIVSKKDVTAVLGGEYRSVFKGRGIEFEEVRDYVPGDDIRTVEWKTTAKKGTLYVKKFREERELTVMLLFDTSSSLDWGSALSKREKAAEVAALLALSALYNKDKVGLLNFSHREGRFIPPKGGREHFLVLLRSLFFREKEEGPTDIAVALRWFNRVSRKRVIAFLISDFSCHLNFEKELTFAAGKHDFIGVWIRDREEGRFFEDGPVTLSDMESGDYRVGWLNGEKLRELLQDHEQKLKALFARTGADLIEVFTDQPALQPIQRFFRKRLKR